MARRPRLYIEGGIYHAMTRGDGSRALFHDTEAYGLFSHLLIRAKKRFRFRLYAYCLMPNHFHLLLQVSQAPISSIMHWLQLCYAKAFNREQQRWGHVFQDRFESPLCSDDRYFLQLLRYIHLNPVRAKLVDLPEKWAWSGHLELAGLRRPILIDKDFPMSLFSADEKAAVRFYRAHLSGCADDDLEDGMASGSAFDPETVVGGAHRLETAQRTAAKDWHPVAEIVARDTGIGLPELLSGSRARATARARSTLIQRLIASGLRPGEVAEILSCSPALVSKVCRE